MNRKKYFSLIDFFVSSEKTENNYVGLNDDVKSMKCLVRLDRKSVLRK